MLITLEGMDGVGKDAVAIELRDKLIKLGHKAVVINEMSHDRVGGFIRHRILTGKIEVDNLTLAYLMVSARIDNIVNKIVPLIEEGNIVICTRGPISILVHQLQPILDKPAQGVMHSISANIASMVATSIDHILKDHLIEQVPVYLTCDYETIQSRLGTRDILDIIESQSDDEKVKRYEYYSKITAEHGYHPVSNDGSIINTVGNILELLDL